MIVCSLILPRSSDEEERSLMKQFVFREDLNEARMMRRIKRQLDTHRLISLVDLCRALKVPPGVVRPYLERMLAGGSIRRLRPVEYNKEDRDYYHPASLRPGKRSAPSLTLMGAIKNRARGWLAQAELSRGRGLWKERNQLALDPIGDRDAGMAARAGA